MDTVRAGERGAVLVAQTIAEETTLLGQQLVGGGGDLGQVDVVVLPRDDVAGASDANDDLIVLVLGLARGEDVIPLGVQGPPGEPKDQGADPRSDKRKSHVTQAQPLARTCLLLW